MRRQASWVHEWAVETKEVEIKLLVEPNPEGLGSKADLEQVHIIINL